MSSQQKRWHLLACSTVPVVALCEVHCRSGSGLPEAAQVITRREPSLTSTDDGVTVTVGGAGVSNRINDTVRCHYKAVSFVPSTRSRHPIVRLWGGDIGWVQSLIDILLLWFRCIMKYHETLHCVRTESDCVYCKLTGIISTKMLSGSNMVPKLQWVICGRMNFICIISLS